MKLLSLYFCSVLEKECNTHHTICEGSPSFKMGPQTLVGGLEAQPTNEELAELLRLTGRLNLIRGKHTGLEANGDHC